MSILKIVVPCYNEEEVLHESAKQLTEQLEKLIAGGKISSESQILFVDDGSKDKTWEIISLELNFQQKIYQSLLFLRR